LRGICSRLFIPCRTFLYTRWYVWWRFKNVLIIHTILSLSLARSLSDHPTSPSNRRTTLSGSKKVLFIVLPIQFILKHGLPPASTAIIAFEQVRMFMKSHAFVRSSENSSNNSHKAEFDKPQQWYPDFSHYLYFLFAPTLIYRDSYPRTNSIRWSYVATNLFQVAGCVLLSYYMLRFGDRLFYKDWWNSTTFSTWYRTWNVVVHDWLYIYLYRDLQRFAPHRSRQLAAAVVFWLSAAVHEYVLILVLRFVYPVLFVFFAFAGYPFIYVKGSCRGWNVFIWVLLFIGWGQMMCLYSMEWYARKNCQPVFGSWIDVFVPHSWFCRPLARPMD
uniref:MBOAT_2 domain-containing protein n=1 Tax=Echinostoma caproni TaxID=27848 RepID=A0A183BF36_9TREM